jgi:hypothetical protein
MHDEHPLELHRIKAEEMKRIEEEEKDESEK